MTDLERALKLEHAIRCAIQHPAIPAFVAAKLREALDDATRHDMMQEEEA